jgi:hypothetical protein
MYCYHAHLLDVHLFESGRKKLAIGRARISSCTTRGQLRFSFAALYLGEHNLIAGIRPCRGTEGLPSFVEQAGAAFSMHDLAACSRLIDERFRGATYSLKSLFHDERQRIVKQIVDFTLADIDHVYAKVYKQHASLTSFLSELHIPIPAILQVSADFVLGNAIQRCLAEERMDVARIRKLLDTAKQDGVSLVSSSLGSGLRQRLKIVLDQWAKDPFDLSKLGELESVVLLAQIPPFHLDLWQAQNVYYKLLQAISRDQNLRFSRKWFDRFEKVGELLGVAVITLAIQLPDPTSDLVPLATAAALGTVVASSDERPADTGTPRF